MAMDQVLEQLVIATPGAGFTRLNEQLNDWIRSSGIQLGVLHLTCLHTSASLTINENADPRVLQDLNAWMDAVVPQDGKGPLDGQGQRRRYKHDDEGDDDMPAHIRTALTSQTMTLSVEHGRLLLGMWQAVYLWEHRAMPHRRRIACHLIGEREQGSTSTAPANAVNTATPEHPSITPTTRATATSPGGASAQTLLNLRNGGRINQAVQARFDPTAWERDGGIDTDVDLLIDRLHDLSDPHKSDNPG